MKIFTKLFLSHGLIGLVSVSVFSLIFYFLLRDALIERTIDQLSSINILKKNQVENYFSQIQKDIEFQVEQEWTKDKGRGDKQVFIKQIQFELRAFSKMYHFKKTLLIDDQFHALDNHSVDTINLQAIKNKIDFTCHCFQIIDSNEKGNLQLFYIFPMVTVSGVYHIIMQDDFSKIQSYLFETTGMGSTGESYIVGSDFKMRSASRFYSNTLPNEILVRTTAVINGLKTVKNPEHIIIDYRGQKVLSYYRPLEISSLKWVLISEIDFNEAMKPIIQLRNYLIVLVISLMAIVLAVTIVLSRELSRPILNLRNVILKLSIGVIPSRIEVFSMDEIGQITNATNELLNTLNRTTEFANEIGSGNFNASFKAISDDDTLGNALIHMRDQLKEFNEREIRLVREKTSAVMDAQENERKRIVRELHDGVGQLLTALRLRLERLENKEAANEFGFMINDIIAEVKRVSYNLMPNAIIDFGLAAALRGLCENATKYTPLIFDFQYVQESDKQLSFDISIALYRIVQEALNNIIKHARATHVVLHVIAEDEEIYVLIKDDGIGFKPDEQVTPYGFGLTNMHQRAHLLNGQLEIESNEEGTTIEAHIPVSDEKNKTISG